MPRVLPIPVDFQAYEFAALTRSQLDGRVRLRLLALTGEDIRQLLVEQFGVRYSLNGVYALLARLRLVWITVRFKHPQHDALAQEAFKKTLLTRSRRYSQAGSA